MILSLADEIKRLCSPRHVHILSYQPTQYNQLYQEVQNLNLLLANAHAQTIQALREATGCQFALVDQFGDAFVVPNILQEMGCQITIEQRVRAEGDVAVAAASIVARAEFVKQLAELSQMVGITLPKGASDPHIVLVGREIVMQAGQETLGKVAKLHFKTTQTILQ